MIGLAVAALVAMAAGYATWREAAPFIFAGAEAAERTTNLIAGTVHPGYSFHSHQQVLESCFRLIGTVYVKTRPTALRTKLAETCNGLAMEAIAAMPSYSFALLVAAQTSIQLKDISAFNAAMLRSGVTGPSEQWIAELRVALIEDNIGVASPEVRERETADLKLLVLSQRGFASIAGRYLAQPDFRERLTAIVETLPAADQNRFVYFVRLAAQPR